MDINSGKKERRARRSRQEVREILSRFEESGLTQLAFAQEQALKVGTLRNWIKRERKKDVQEGALQEVRLLGSGNSNGGAENVIVRLAGGSEVELCLSADKSWIAAMVRELVKSC